MIVLPCRPKDQLSWNIPSDGPFSVRFDLGLEDPNFPWEDEMHFQALSLSLAHFTETIWQTAGARIQKGVLYQGVMDVSEENFAYYCQMLSHKLPDELPLWLYFDMTGLSPTSAHQILSQDRFAHFQIAVRGLPSYCGSDWEGRKNEAPHALCFPEENRWGSESLQRLTDWMATKKTPFRVIYESCLAEEWDGVETLYVLKNSMSPQGIRKLTGFQAAGGEVIEVI